MKHVGRYQPIGYSSAETDVVQWEGPRTWDPEEAIAFATARQQTNPRSVATVVDLASRPRDYTKAETIARNASAPNVAPAV